MLVDMNCPLLSPLPAKKRTEGKARRTIETLTDCYVSIYGRTVAIIGNVENVTIARRAVEGLLRGSKHGNIYKWLEKRRKEVIENELKNA